MSVKMFIHRIIRYFKRHGLFATGKRFFEKFWWDVIRRRNIIYYVELTKCSLQEFELPEHYAIECKKTGEDIISSELETLYSYRGEKIVQNQMQDHFSKGAYLWLIKNDGQVVGMVWMIREHTLKPYYWPMMPGDVHLFDNEIFPDYRGRGINAVFLNGLVVELKDMGLVRAFIETRIINVSERKSLKKTLFVELTTARKWHFLNRDFTSFKARKKQ